jgi:hypothetical protein
MRTRHQTTIITIFLFELLIISTCINVDIERARFAAHTWTQSELNLFSRTLMACGFKNIIFL